MEVSLEHKKFIFVSAVILLFYLFFKIIEPYLTFLALGIILAILVYPINLAIRKKVKNDKTSALITTSMTLIIVVIPTIFLLSTLAGEMISFFSNINLDFIQKASAYLTELTGQESYFIDNLGKMATSATEYILSSTPNIIGSVADGLIGIMILFSLTYYILVEGDKWGERLKVLTPLKDSQREHFGQIVKQIVYSTLYGEILIAIIQGILGGVLFSLLEIPNPVMWGFIMGVLAFLPFVGTGIVWGPVAVMRFVNGEYLAAIIVVIYGIILMTGVDYWLRPKVIARAGRIHPLTAILGAFGGIHFFGFTGLILGPMIAALFEAMLIFYYEEQKAKDGKMKPNSKTRRTAR